MGMGMGMGCGMLVLMLMLHFGVPGATASFVCATLLDSRIACLVFRAIYVQPVPSGWRKCGKLIGEPCVPQTFH